MNVAGVVTSGGIVPYQTVCTLVGRTPNIILQHNVVRTIHTVLILSFKY